VMGVVRLVELSLAQVVPISAAELAWNLLHLTHFAYPVAPGPVSR
jgi:hypothetical protein